jgi:hypothetical protein
MFLVLATWCLLQLVQLHEHAFMMTSCSCACPGHSMLTDRNVPAIAHALLGGGGSSGCAAAATDYVQTQAADGKHWQFAAADVCLLHCNGTHMCTMRSGAVCRYSSADATCAAMHTRCCQAKGGLLLLALMPVAVAVSTSLSSSEPPSASSYTSTCCSTAARSNGMPT